MSKEWESIHVEVPGEKAWDPDGKDEQRTTPLHLAAFSDSLDILMCLIEERMCSPSSPLHAASQKNLDLAIVMYLVEKCGCDPAGKDDDGDTPLNVA